MSLIYIWKILFIGALITACTNPTEVDDELDRFTVVSRIQVV